jgi:hypothetical protein
MSLDPSNLFHVWNHCHACGAQPINGRRFECLTGSADPDDDLCERCYQLFEVGQVQDPGAETVRLADCLDSSLVSGSRGAIFTRRLFTMAHGSPSCCP